MNLFSLRLSYSRTTLVVAASLIVLAVSAYIGPRASITQLAPFVGVIGLLILLRNPELGLIAVLVSAMSIPITIGTGTQTKLNMAIILIPALLLLWIVEMLRRRDLRLVPSPTNLPLFAFILSVTISLIAGSVPWNYFADTASLSSQIGGWAIFVCSAAIFLLVGNQIKDLRWLEVLTWIFLGLGAVAEVGRALRGEVGNVANYIVLDENGAGSLLWVWLVALAGGQAIFNRKLNRFLRAGLAALTIVVLSVAWLRYRWWTSGWLPEMVTLWVLIALRSRRAGIALAIAGAIFVLVLDPEVIPNLATAKQYSTDTRMLASEIILTQVVPSNPVIGLGPANYYFYTPLYPILGYYVSFNSHNQYVDIIAQTGLVGLAVFGWLMTSIGYVAWKLKDRAAEGFSRAYVYTCLAGLVGMLFAGTLADWVLPFVYNIGISGFRVSMLGWLFLGGLVSLKYITDRDTPASSREEALDE
ncbi:MAG TPA: O-antigen ligase family protein [Anaerolineae bacterium]